MADKLNPRKALPMLVISLCAGGFGALGGYFVAHYVARNLPDQRWSDGLALAIATGMLVLGVFMVAAGFVDRLAQALGKSDKATAKMKRQYLMQGITLLLAGIMLAAPALLPANALTHLQSGWLLAIIFVLFAVQTTINLDLWRTADEFYRRAMLETSAISFWVLQGALFLWAVAERTGFAPSLQSWDMVAVLMAVYLVLSIIVARRLGAG